jgi:hypothetical protein
LGAGLEMAALAGKAAARKALGGIGGAGADLVRGIDYQGVAVFNELAERVVPNLTDLGGRPLGKIDLRQLRGGGVRIPTKLTAPVGS